MIIGIVVVVLVVIDVVLAVTFFEILIFTSIGTTRCQGIIRVVVGLVVVTIFLTFSFLEDL